jgi:ribonuclease VapC
VNEPESDSLAEKIEQATTQLITSPISVFGSTVNYARIMDIRIDEAQERTSEFLFLLKVRDEFIIPEIGKRAIQAYQKYGRGNGHRAKLNMGDAFSYGCSKHHSVPLLYKGNDFSQTDLA